MSRSSAAPCCTSGRRSASSISSTSSKRRTSRRSRRCPCRSERVGRRRSKPCLRSRSRTSCARSNSPNGQLSHGGGVTKRQIVRDPRIDEYARLLIERSVGVRPGWQVCIRGTPLARPLIESLMEQIARLGAYPILQLAFESIGGPFAREAPLALLRQTAPLQERIWREVDAVISIWAPEDTHEGADLSEERLAAAQQSLTPLRERTMSMSVPWVIAEYATEATAEEAGMTVPELAEFIFEAVLRDWDAEAKRM